MKNEGNNVQLENKVNEPAAEAFGSDSIESNRKMVEDLLEIPVDKIESFIELLPDGVAIIDLEGNIFITNDEGAKIQGYDRKEEIIGRNGFEFIAPDSLDRAADTLETIIKEGNVKNVEYKLIRKDGTSYYSDLSASLIKDANGNPRALLSVSRDVNERKRIEEALKESEETASAYMNAITDTAVLLDTNGTIQAINEIGAQRLGKKIDEIAGKNIKEIFPPEVFEFRQSQAAEVIRTGKLIRYEDERSGMHFDTSVCPVFDKQGNVNRLAIFARDITEMKKTEDKYRDLIEKEKDIIYSLDKNGKITFVNPAIEEILGYKPEETIGKNFVDFIPTEMREKMQANFKYLLKTGEITKETALMDKNGQLHYIEYSSTTIKEGDKIIGTRGIVRDITESKRSKEELERHQKHLQELVDERTNELQMANEQLQRDIKERERAEEALRESEEKYRNLVERANDGITIIQDTILKYVNPSLAEMMGYSVKEMTDTPFTKYITTEELPKVTERYKRRMKGEDVPQVYVTSVINKNGKKIDVELNAGIITFGGKLADLVLVRDVTERKQAEEALRESEEMYKSLVRALPDSVTTTDLEGNVTYASPRTADIHGFKNAKEMLGKSAFELIAPEHQEIAAKNLEKTLNVGVIRNLEYTLMRKDGSTFTGLLSAALIKDANNNPKSFIAAVRDISERKRTEEQIKDSLKEKEVLVREIHHRVKNNIQVINSMLNLHSGFIKDKKYIETLQEIQNRIKSMALIHEKLYKSKDLAHVDFNEYINDLVNSLFRFYGVNINEIKPKISAEEISLDLDAAIPCGLIINELVSNSLKHGFPDEKKYKDGKVRIELIPKRKKKITMVISDNGIGFPQELDLSNVKTFGLQLVNTLVEQLDGTIELNKENGTEFNITFLT